MAKKNAFPEGGLSDDAESMVRRMFGRVMIPVLGKQALRTSRGVAGKHDSRTHQAKERERSRLLVTTFASTERGLVACGHTRMKRLRSCELG